MRPALAYKHILQTTANHERLIASGLAVAWLLLVSVFTILKYAPNGINADFIMNSVMSLQNLTLYYWGQNRLLNILPFTTRLITEPKANFYATLLITTLCFFLVIYSVTAFAVKTSQRQKQNYLTTSIFVSLSAFYVLALTPYGLRSAAFQQIEYSAALLFALTAFYVAWFVGWKPFFKYSLICVLVFLSVGLNPSMIVPLVLSLVFWVIYNARLNIPNVVIAVATLSATLAWSYISSLYGNTTYNSFSFQTLLTGLPKTTPQLGGLIRPEMVLAFQVGWFLWYFKNYGTGSRNVHIVFGLRLYVTSVVWVFSIVWLFLFSSSEWVSINNFNSRYFLPIVFSLLMIFALQLVSLFEQIKLVYWAMIAAISSATCLTATYTKPLSYKDYSVFRTLPADREKPYGLYAGNYWVVWPAVLFDLMDNKPAYGLTFRAAGNEENLRKFIESKIHEEKKLFVYCMDDERQECRTQVQYYAGKIYLDHATIVRPKDPKVTLFKFVPFLTKLKFSGREFSQLPSNAGSLKDHTRTSNRTAGCLFFGPYVAMRSGSYKLSIYGSSGNIETAIADVVSESGQKIHGAFHLSSMTEGALVDDAKVKIPEGVDDLEVRLCLTEVDEVKVSSYNLQRVISTKVD